MQQLENGMVANQEQHDTQCKPLEYICPSCQEPCNSITHFLNGDDVCDDCKSEYLRLNGGEFAEDFVYQHQQGYYVNWWFNNLTEQQKLSIIKSAYQQKELFEQLIGTVAEHSLMADRVEFCMEQDGFLSYVETCLT